MSASSESRVLWLSLQHVETGKKKKKKYIQAAKCVFVVPSQIYWAEYRLRFHLVYKCTLKFCTSLTRFCVHWDIHKRPAVKTSDSERD